MDVEEQFRVLSSYLQAKSLKRHEDNKGKPACDKLKEGDKDSIVSRDEVSEKCMHPDHVVHQGFYVCTSCGLVSDTVFLPEVNWESRCLKARSYAAVDRLQAVDRHLKHFMGKAGISAPIHPLQERLRYWKKESRYRSLNYAIALTCVLYHDVHQREKLIPFLPESNVSWARSSQLMNPVPNEFVVAWYRHLMRNPKQLSRPQANRFSRNVARLEPLQADLMYRLIRCHGYYGYDLSALPWELRCALYRFTRAILN